MLGAAAAAAAFKVSVATHDIAAGAIAPCTSTSARRGVIFATVCFSRKSPTVTSAAGLIVLPTARGAWLPQAP